MQPVFYPISGFRLLRGGVASKFLGRRGYMSQESAILVFFEFFENLMKKFITHLT